ncbi:MAG: hypothetical protein JWL65_3070 [Gammaproteobacteria bacterium]|nr:hypothetical protein [Gammaproteobacteria bacterium]
MSVHKGHFERLRRALAASVVALLAVAPALAAEPATPAASRYVPTMADYLGVYDVLQRYRFGVEKHDHKALESAFWEDGADIAVPNPGQEIRMPLNGSPPPQAPAGQPGPNTGPPLGMGPPPGSNAGPAGPGGGGGEVWHLPLDSYIHFESATRATHYEYFLSIYPQPEKKAEGDNPGNMQNSRTSIVGWPGHYEDILEKRHGEWRILQRKSMINQK